MIINRRHALLLTTLAFANAFAPPLWCPHQRAGFRQPSTTTQQWLYSNDEQDDGIDAMRMLLESSWNINTMGQVPINAEAAADAAVESLNSALDAASSMSTKSRVFFIDILLPQYDIRQGPKVYDEILATEFCIHLAKRLKGRSEILVRDDKTLAVVERVLSARERESQANDKDVDDASRDDSRQDEGDATVSVEQGSDDDSEGMQQKPSAGTPATDIESFRQQLITGWTEDDKDDDGILKLESESNVESERSDESLVEEEPVNDISLRPTKLFRLASMLGSAAISAGSDRRADVLRAVEQHGRPTADEDTVIILSASGPEEMIAVRTLVAKYGETKTFILINCNLQPTPRELSSAQMVYSVQPFIARPRQGDQEDRFQPKIVVMRRHPADWEVFVDASGEGFELAGTFGSNRVARKGPSMQEITACVKRHLESRGARQ